MLQTRWLARCRCCLSTQKRRDDLPSSSARCCYFHDRNGPAIGLIMAQLLTKAVSVSNSHGINDTITSQPVILFEMIIVACQWHCRFINEHRCACMTTFAKHKQSHVCQATGMSVSLTQQWPCSFPLPHTYCMLCYDTSEDLYPNRHIISWCWSVAHSAYMYSICSNTVSCHDAGCQLLLAALAYAH